MRRLTLAPLALILVAGLSVNAQAYDDGLYFSFAIDQVDD